MCGSRVGGEKKRSNVVDEQPHLEGAILEWIINC